MKLVILEFKMFLFVFGIFAGMILTLILMGIYALFQKDNKSIEIEKNENSIPIPNDNSNSEEIIEDLIMCDMLDILELF